jgi:intracellular septation protein
MRNTRVLLNIAVEFGPLLLFFIIAEPLGFVRAVAVFVALTLTAVVVDLRLQRRFAVFPVVVALFIVGFGGATLVSGNPRYIELNYTVYPLVFGLVAFMDLAFFRNRIFRSLFGNVFAIEDRGWYLTTRNWVVMFLLMAVANELAREQLTPERWIIFRIMTSAFVLAFSAYQFTIARRYRLPEANEFGLRVVS